MVVEPFANDRLEENLNPVGRVYYGASTQVCVPVSLAKKGPALGAQAGEQRLRDVFVDRRRLHALPPRHGDAVQHGARGAPVT